MRQRSAAPGRRGGRGRRGVPQDHPPQDDDEEGKAEEVTPDPVEYRKQDTFDEETRKTSGAALSEDSLSSSSEEDEEDEYVAYGPQDVETATQRVLAYLRGHYGRAEEEEKVTTTTSSRRSLPATRRAWSRDGEIARLCRVDRQVEPPAVAALLARASLIQLLPPPDVVGQGDQALAQDTADDGGAKGTDGDRVPVGRFLQEGIGQQAAAAAVGVEWTAGEKDMVALEEVLTRQFGDGSIILARVLPWLRARPRPPKARNKLKGKKEEQGRLPSTLKELLEVIRREQWGIITHHVRPDDVVWTS